MPFFWLLVSKTERINVSIPTFDPESVPVDTIAGEAAVALSRLNLDWIRARFAQPVAWEPEVSDEASLLLNPNDLIRAAVLITLIQRQHGLSLLLTRRTAHLKHHAGQISFPGGRIEADDASEIAAALREAQEEIGLNSAEVDILGVLPDYCTGTGYRVTPVVAYVRSAPELQSEVNEVAEIFEVPLAYLMNGQHHQRRSAVTPMQRRVFYTMPYEGYFIWGATAAMLRNLFHFLRA